MFYPRADAPNKLFIQKSEKLKMYNFFKIIVSRTFSFKRQQLIQKRQEPFTKQMSAPLRIFQALGSISHNGRNRYKNFGMKGLFGKLAIDVVQLKWQLGVIQKCNATKIRNFASSSLYNQA